MTDNRTSQAIESILQDLRKKSWSRNDLCNELKAIAAKYQRMEEVLKKVEDEHDSECMTRLCGGECDCVSKLAKEALAFDPLS